MRKLLVASLLVSSTFLCAQPKVVSIDNQKLLNRNNFEQAFELQSPNRKVVKAIERIDQPTSLQFQTSLEKAAGNYGYVGKAYAFWTAYSPAFFDVTVQIDGTNATFKSLFGINGIADVKGTVSGAKVIISKDQKVMDLRLGTTPVDGLIGEIDPYTGTITDIVFQQENGRFTYVPSSEDCGIFIYAKSGDGIAVLEAFRNVTLNDIQNMEPDYTNITNLWYYGVDAESGAGMTVPGAVASSEQESIEWISYVTMLKNASYSVNWEYMADEQLVTPEVDSQGILSMKLNPSVQEYTFPTITATSGGYTNEYGITDGFIAVNKNSLVQFQEGILDLGFGLSNITTNGMVLPTPYGEHMYGKGIVSTEEGEISKAGVVSVYQEVVPINFTSVGMIAFVENASLGKKLSLEVRELIVSEEGASISPDVLAKSEITLTKDDNYFVIGQYDREGNTFGIINFSDFVGIEDGFETTLDKVITGKDFVLILTGIDAANIGVAMENTPNYAGAILGMPESAYIMGSDNGLYPMGTYSNLMIYFYGSQFNATGISDVKSATQNVIAINDGSSIQLTYPEGMKSVEVINVAGQVISEYSLEGTSATIPAANLSKGLYLLKFNTGATVKVMR